MNNKKSNSKFRKTKENHETAAWANIEKVKPDSNVPIPSDFDVDNAKNYVDTNEK